jgi:hypothetical protein
VIVAGIVACEIAFWLFLVAGLAVRYLLRRPRLSRYLLLGSPVADLGLLVLSATDLARGVTATQAHALAAAYISFTVVFGPSVIRRRRAEPGLGRIRTTPGCGPRVLARARTGVGNGVAILALSAYL